MILEEYHKKRKFSKTPEPFGKLKTSRMLLRAKHGTSGIFVVHKHHAKKLHYDFRLAIGRVLKSWAVPKAVPEKPGIKHLAIQVEDHPLEYAKFSGEIPKGEYGAGRVEIWDKGKYNNLKAKSQNSKIKSIEVDLSGKKLRGKYILVRTALGDVKNSWLIFKTK